MANPYALAELAVGRKVNWKSIKDHEAFVEKTLGASIETLCAPVKGNLIPSSAADSQKVLADIHEMKADKKAAAFSDRAELLAIRSVEFRRRIRDPGGDLQEILLAVRLGKLSVPLHIAARGIDAIKRTPRLAPHRRGEL